MDNITWLHLSDWHQKGEEFNRTVVRDALVKDIREREKISPSLSQIDFVVFTGDIAFSGRSEEYDAAVEHFFRPLIDAWGIGDEGWKRLYLVPGNHDIDRNEVNNLKSTISLKLDRPEDVSKALAIKWQRDAILSTFSKYRNFVSKYFGASQNGWSGDPAYSYSSKLKIGAKNITILGFNSAWFSARNLVANNEINDYGYLIMGEPQVYDRLQEVDESELVIALMHHPLSWLIDFDRDPIEEQLSRRCHFILHGHQHLPRVNVSQGTLGNVVIVPGGASYDRRLADNPRYTNAYNFVNLNFDTNQGTAYLRRWSEQQGAWIEDNELYPGGSFQFTLTQGLGLQDQTKKEALHKIVAKYIPRLRRRFCEQIEISMRQTLEDFESIKLVRHEVIHKITVAPGPPEDFGLETFSDDRVNKLVESRKLELKPYTAHYFRVNGQDLKPETVERKRVVFWAQLGKDANLIDYKYTLYLKPDDVYLLRIGGFTQKFKFRLRRDKSLVYDLRPVGGLPPAELKSHDFFDYDEMEISELCLPDQGYLIQWNQPDAESPAAPDS